MTAYRVYLLSNTDQIIDAQLIDCENDAAAVEQVRQMREPYAVEIWDRDRKVIRFETECALVANR